MGGWWDGRGMGVGQLVVVVVVVVEVVVGGLAADFNCISTCIHTARSMAPALHGDAAELKGETPIPPTRRRTNRGLVSTSRCGWSCFPAALHRVTEISFATGTHVPAIIKSKKIPLRFVATPPGLVMQIRNVIRKHPPSHPSRRQRNKEKNRGK